MNAAAEVLRLRLVREPTRFGATLGSLYLNGVWHCWTLEDALRDIPGRPVAEWKRAGETAIPAGRYLVEVTYSSRFARRMPEIMRVPGFTGVRIHTGNNATHTEGCILVGRARLAAAVSESKAAYAALFAKLDKFKGEVWLQIENPLPPAA